MVERLLKIGGFVILRYEENFEVLYKRINIPSVDELVNSDWFNETEYSCAANGTLYRKDIKSFSNEIMEDVFAKRAGYQKDLKSYEMIKDKDKTNIHDNVISELDIKQYALKIAINAYYGMLANKYSRWNSIDLAESITLSGQLTVKWVLHKINIYLNKNCKTEGVDYVCAGDTDSNYIVLKPLLIALGVDTSNRDLCVKVIDDFYKKHLDKVIKDAFEELHVKMAVLCLKHVLRPVFIRVMMVIANQDFL